MSHALQHKVKQRLHELSPRAFEYFAGDLLTFMGLAAVEVTRYTGDGGIDAHCELVSGGILRVPAGVQVKRLRQAVPRPEMDRFVGALANRYSCGIFITTAGFTKTALQKAASIPHVTTVGGDQVAGILVARGAGVSSTEHLVDEDYFGQFEERAAPSGSPKLIAEGKAALAQSSPVDDLISLRALSYALHIDSKTVRGWVQRGLLQPDMGGGYLVGENQSGLFFHRSRIDEIRRQFGLAHDPATTADWSEGFLRFAMEGRLNKSYKPVMLLALLDNVNGAGEILEAVLVEAFWDFYRLRCAAGLTAEVASSILSQPETATTGQVRALLVGMPLERFVIKGYLQHFPDLGLVRVRPEVWEGLRYRDVLVLRASLQEQVESYFRLAGSVARVSTEALPLAERLPPGPQ
jgi:hypothetical protein